MAENDEFDQNQDQEGHIDTNFHPEQQEEFEADPKEEEKPPSRNGFLPKLVLDPKVDPNADLIKVMLNNTLHGHDVKLLHNICFKKTLIFFMLLCTIRVQL